VQPPGVPLKPDVAGMADLAPSLENSYDNDNSNYECDNLSDLGYAQGKRPISLNPTEFSSKQFAERIGQANYSVFNK